MCGIAGYYWEDRPADAAIVRAMCDVIRHRGPDDEGFHVEGPCALGMRRLSIIDLNTGHQPISNEDGTVWVVFNGEIYNFQELREDLCARGHRFRTRSDTEVLVHLYEEEGESGLARLRGMFAFAIWDAGRRRVLLARDRFGKKPLYYAVSPRGLVFGSELKCLLEAGVPTDVDREALRLYFVFSYIPDPWSPFQAVRKLAPGSWLVYEAGGQVRRGTYWKMPPPAESAAEGDTEEAAAERIRDAFDEAVRIRMISDVPLGAFLSGGIDSSLIVSSMARQSAEPVRTFSIGFEESAFNELPYARMVAERFGTEHHEVTVRPESLSLVERLVRHFDEPFADSSAIPTFLVSEFAARHVKVALSGDGGDELFAGYSSLCETAAQQRYDRIPQPVRKAIGKIAAWLPYSAYGKNWLRMVSQSSPVGRYFAGQYAPYYLRQALLESDWMLPADEAHLIHTMAHCLLPGQASALSQAIYFETTSNLTSDMLVKVDRMSMANSLEVRCPLLDHRLAELAAACPTSWKIKGGRGKQILIRALGDRLPPELLTRPKAGFAIPIAVWFRGELRSFLRDHLDSPRFLERGIVQPVFLRYLIEEHESARRDNSHWLWGLLMLELWFRQVEERR